MPTEQTASPLELHPDLVCDACGAAIAGEPLHYCGRLNGVETAHIHLCERCAAPLPRIVVQDGHVLPAFWPAPITHRPPTEADGDEYGCVLVPGRCGWAFLPWRVVERDAYRWLPLPNVERTTAVEETVESELHDISEALNAPESGA